MNYQTLGAGVVSYPLSTSSPYMSQSPSIPSGAMLSMPSYIGTQNPTPSPSIGWGNITAQGVGVVGSIASKWLELETAKVNARSQSELNRIAQEQAALQREMAGQQSTQGSRNTMLAAVGVGVAALVGFMALKG